MHGRSRMTINPRRLLDRGATYPNIVRQNTIIIFAIAFVVVYPEGTWDDSFCHLVYFPLPACCWEISSSDEEGAF